MPRSIREATRKIHINKYVLNSKVSPPPPFFPFSSCFYLALKDSIILLCILHFLVARKRRFPQGNRKYCAIWFISILFSYSSTSSDVSVIKYSIRIMFIRSTFLPRIRKFRNSLLESMEGRRSSKESSRSSKHFCNIQYFR